MKFVSKLLMFLMVNVGLVFASEKSTSVLDQVIEVQRYNRAIHIMAMLLVGFGFLMVFVKKYGKSSVTATYLLVGTAIPLYFIIKGFGGHSLPEIDRMILAEFAAASLLIAAGAVLGRLKLYQYIILGLLFVPVYFFNEWILLDGGLGIIKVGALFDTGGSIVIHMFGAFFGLGAIFALTTKKQYEVEIEADSTSDRFSLLGSMVLWVFWPSFCAALVAPADIPQTVVNVILALCGSTIATYIASLLMRKKVSIADIANASLAGGVAIGSVCDKTDGTTALIIGIIAGVVSTFGFAVIQDKLQGAIKKADTCGVLYLHGLPGILGGLSALFVAKGVNPAAQILSIVITIIVGIVGGLIVGKIVSLTGKKENIYDDGEDVE